MTLDCTAGAGRPNSRRCSNATRSANGIARFGLHRQAAALMTCFVPSATHDHIHFVDGAMGGYAMAAQALKTEGTA